MSTLELACRGCGTLGLDLVLSLGKTPLANGLLKREALDHPEPVFPLDLAFCPACALLQLTESVPPEQLFSDYPYFSSFSDTMVKHAERIAERLTRARELGADSLVIEIASNDGYLLQHYQRQGIPVLGIEPAENVAEVARKQHGIRTTCAFFGQELGETLAAAGERANVIHANNVLAHVPDINGFIAGIAALLKPGGVAVIEAPYAKDMLDHLEFDTIYHEHMFYFSLSALKRLFERHGLTLVDVERLPIHGGSLRIFTAHQGQPSPAVSNLLAEEAAWGVDNIQAYLDFAGRVETLKLKLKALLAGIKDEGKRVAVYGASAKGATLLNTFGLGGDTLEFVVDRSTAKQGLYTPGTRLPIHSPDKLLEALPDYALLLSWNFAEEILAQQAEYRARGGRFIVPLPEPQVL